MTNFWQAFGRVSRAMLSFVATYLLVVPIGTVVFMVVLGVVGYIPYSDRPGPGLEGWLAGASWEEIKFLIAFGLLLLMPSAMLATIVFAISRLLAWMRVPRWAAAVLFAPLCGFLSSYLVLSIGWFIAIGSVAVYGSMILGLAFGIWLAPQKPGSRASVHAVSPKI